MKDYYPYPKRDPIKNYFPLPRRRKLHIPRFAVVRHGKARPFRCASSLVAGPLCWALPRVFKTSPVLWVDELVEKKLVKVESTKVITKDGVKRNGTLMYTIRPIQEAIDYYNEVQWKKIELGLAQVRVAKAKEKMKSPPTIKLTKLSTTADPPKMEEGPVMADFGGEKEKAG